MGRPKTYERSTVTAAAMEPFWRRGYHDVSTRELVDAMAINMNTLYSEFGTRAGLFNAAIEHYEQHVVPLYIGALEQPDASIDTICDVHVRHDPGAHRRRTAAGRRRRRTRVHPRQPRLIPTPYASNPT